MIRSAVRGTGKTLIGLGVLILLFVAYQLWGTGLAHSRAQSDLKAQFDATLRAPTTTTPPGAEPVAPPPPVLGEAVAVLQIPKIGVDEHIVEGVEVEDLKKGPGHYPGTRMPGEAGNAAIAGHRTTYGAPFFRLNELEKGDEMLVTTKAGEFRYLVDRIDIVTPDDTYVLDETQDNRLTLTTCHPRYSAAQRMIVVGHLEGPVVPTAPVAPSTRPPTLAAEGGPGLSGGTSARGPAVGWGLLAALVLLATWYLSRLWSKRWAACLVGAPVFLAVLFMFFENFALLLPANV